MTEQGYRSYEEIAYREGGFRKEIILHEQNQFIIDIENGEIKENRPILGIVGRGYQYARPQANHCQGSTKLLERFSNDFAQLLETEYDYNVVVKVGNQNFKLHSLILYQRSSFFRKELSTAIKQNNIIEITLADTSVESFKILIKYIYTGKVRFEEVEPSIIFDLLVPSIFDSDEFTSIQENALITLLNRDDLQIEESEIWDKVIQWGKAKTPDLPSDLKTMDREEFFRFKDYT
ncbi:hypothetical protein C2G38_2228663 [Gigaspora rosea]|uniref:BTB domain-containing protein n=1 Tax=Gigaspora rosea TaxID=44941 RepID=A0A397TZA4_9GLOM|nr:hypothetical protein C2G38_2228663 [Gigaspora rosea]